MGEGDVAEVAGGEELPDDGDGRGVEPQHMWPGVDGHGVADDFRLTAGEEVAGEDPEDLGAGAEAAPEVAADFLGASEAMAVADGDFLNTEALASSADLHFDRPAVIPVAHSQAAQTAGADGAEGAEVRGGLAVEPTQQFHAEPVAPALVGAE